MTTFSEFANKALKRLKKIGEKGEESSALEPSAPTTQTTPTPTQIQTTPTQTLIRTTQIPTSAMTQTRIPTTTVTPPLNQSVTRIPTQPPKDPVKEKDVNPPHPQHHEQESKTRLYARGMSLDWKETVWLEVNMGEESLQIRKLNWVIDPYDYRVVCTTASVGASVYLVGGELGDVHLVENPELELYPFTADVFRLDDVTNVDGKKTFQASKSMTNPHSFARVVVLHGKMYVFNRHSEFFDPKFNSWYPFPGNQDDSDLIHVKGLYTDPPNNRILVYSDVNENITPLYEFRPQPQPNRWTCLNPKFKPLLRIDFKVSVLWDNFIIAQILDRPEFVFYDLTRHQWSDVVWKSNNNLDKCLFNDYQPWRCLLHIGNGTLLMARDEVLRVYNGSKDCPSYILRLDILTFKVTNTDGTILATAPTYKYIFVEDTRCFYEYFLI